MSQYCFRGRWTSHPIAWICVSIVAGTLLGLAIPTMISLALSGTTSYRLAFAGLIGVTLVAMAVTGRVREIWLACLTLSIPLNLLFAPLKDAVPLPHPGGASVGLVLYLMDFPLLGLIALSVLNGQGVRGPFRLCDVDVAAILFIAWSALSLYNSSAVLFSVFEIVRMIKLYVLCRIVASQVTRKVDLGYVLAALMAGLVLESVFGVLQYTVNFHIGLNEYTVGALRRVTGTVGWPNTFGAYIAAVIALLIGLVLVHTNRKLRILAGLACIVGFLPLVLTLSRGAWAALLSSIGVILVLAAQRKRLGPRGLLTLLVFLSFAGTATALFANSVVTRLAQTDIGESAIVARMRLIQVAVGMIVNHPILGIGINTFVNVMRYYDTTGISLVFPEPVHNVFLLIAAETGLVGLALFLVLSFFVMRLALTASRNGDPFLSALAVGITGAVTVLLVSNLADVHLRTDVLYSLFWLLIGMLLAIKRISTVQELRNRRGELR